MTGAVLSVEKLSGYIQRIFESEELLHNILVAGEISNFSVSGGTAYFLLKDERASLSCVCFEVRTKGFLPKNGDKVVVKGSPGYYPRLGRLSFLVSRIESGAGQGLLYLKYAALRDRLEREGKFDPSKKRPLPRYAARIGVVTSRSGAVIHDIITVAKRRNPAVEILLSPVRVQGAGADEEIARGIRRLYGRGVDVVIVGRGGGSKEDIEAFYSERVVDAVCQCPVPVVSAVGHETDFTLCDYAADVRAATPSVAAELCVFSQGDYLAELRAACTGCREALDRRLEREKFRLSQLAGNLSARGSALCLRNFSRVKNTASLLYEGVSKRYYEAAGAVERERARLAERNPEEVLKRGYARISKRGRTVTSAAELSPGDVVTIRLADGERRAKIEENREVNG